jgi:cell division ATPase FtsA
VAPLHPDRDLADADLADEGMVAAEAALDGIAQPEQEALVAARHRLQADVAVGGEGHRLPGQVEGARVALGRNLRLHQPLGAEDVGHAGHVGVEGGVKAVMLGLEPGIACRSRA